MKNVQVSLSQIQVGHIKLVGVVKLALISIKSVLFSVYQYDSVTYR